jgi:restriction endonuclease Mrr
MSRPVDEVMRNAAKELETALAGELLEKVMTGTPAFFESVVCGSLSQWVMAAQ